MLKLAVYIVAIFSILGFYSISNLVNQFTEISKKCNICKSIFFKRQIIYLYNLWSDIMKPYYKQLFYISIAVAALLLASFLLFQIESQTASFKIHPEFTRGEDGVIRDMQRMA